VRRDDCLYLYNNAGTIGRACAAIASAAFFSNPENPRADGSPTSASDSFYAPNGCSIYRTLKSPQTPIGSFDTSRA